MEQKCIFDKSDISIISNGDATIVRIAENILGKHQAKSFEASNAKRLVRYYLHVSLLKNEAQGLY